jgi:hypothetical protein
MPTEEGIVEKASAELVKHKQVAVPNTSVQWIF